MLVWLLVLFLLISVIYVVYSFYISSDQVKIKKDSEQHYTFKI
jgi:ABC-type spermidine/putrescine transport system permease subunit I